MSATLPQIRDAIHAKLSGVAGIGIVHKFERYLKREAELMAAYVSGGTLKGWNIRRISSLENFRAVSRYVVTHRWRISGYRAIDDAVESELLFDALLEAIRDAFRTDETLGLTDVITILPEGQAGIQLEDSGPVMFAGVLCHGARLALSTRVYF